MSLDETIKITVGLLTISGTLVAVTRYIVNLQSQVKIERLEMEKSQIEKTFAELKAINEKSQADLLASNKLLMEELISARRAGAAASARKAEVDQELQSIMTIIGSEAASVYIPLAEERSDNIIGLIFLTILPVTDITSKLKKKIIPLTSIAGRCFTLNTPSVIGNAKTIQDHFKNADKVSGFNTQDTLTVPLNSSGKVVGVLQLLNKTESNRFSEDDLLTVKKLSADLAAKVDLFTKTAGSQELLGGVQDIDRENSCATIMFCDLTSSATLFDDLNISSAIQHLNEYFEKICSVVFKYGGTIDKYLGDGALFRFNIPQNIKNHPDVAIQCAIEILAGFNELKRDWITMGEDLNAVYIRISLAYGPVKQALVGHSQYQYLTVFGTAVNAAVNLSEIASRDKSIIVLDEALFKHLTKKVNVNQIQILSEAKAKRYTSVYFELLS